MAQDYYFNSHKPNNSDNNDGTPHSKEIPKQKKDPMETDGTKASLRPAGTSQQKGNAPQQVRQPNQQKQGSPRPTPPRAQRPPLVRSNPAAFAAEKGKQPPKRGKPEPQKSAAMGMSKTKSNILKGVFGALIVCAFTFFVVGMTVLIYSINTVNGDVILNLDTAKYEQAQTTFVYGKDEAGQDIELARLHGTENRIWVDMEKMSPYMKEAFIALEDKRFEKHSGVDWFRTLSAIVRYSGTQGGSTITQQLIKNLTDQKSVTFVRKFNEILTALNLEKHYEKDEIIEAYMNTIFLSQGCYGVETASITYFGKDISELNLAESATLAAITQWPSKYDPLRATRTVTKEDGTEVINNYVQNNKERQEMCLANMLKQKKISQAEYDEAVAYKLVFTNSPEYTGKSATATALTDQAKEAGEYNSYYVDFVIQQVAEKMAVKEGISIARAQKMVNSGGYKIHTAMDYTVQKTLEDVYENYTKMPDHTVQSAMTVMDYHGRVVGIVGGTGPKTGDMVLNRATQSPRPPGSTIKPLAIYAPALELNATHWSKFYSDSASRKSEEQPLVKGSGWPHNDSNEGGDGAMVTVQRALARSFNTIPVRILTDIGFEESKKFLEEKVHLGHLSDNDASYGPLSLGSLTNGATSLEMATAYQMFGNGGYYYEPYAYTKVVDSRNEIVLESKPEETRQQVLSPANATVMNKLLQTVASSDSNGSGAAYKFDSNYEMIAKTGTTTGSKDRWFVAGTPYYIAAVWYGYDEPKEISYSLSYNPSGTIWQTVMKQIHAAKKLAGEKFAVSSDAVQRKYCTSTGNLAGSGCATAYGWYDANNLPATCKGNHGGSGSSDGSSNSNTTKNNNDGDKTTSQTVTTVAPVTEAAPPVTPDDGNADE